jgi:hypothetical protein
LSLRPPITIIEVVFKPMPFREVTLMDIHQRRAMCGIAGVLVMAVLLTAGCSTANRGGLRNSREVYRAFEVYHVYPNHTYYYQGVENNTKALAGLQEPYRIADPDWTPVSPNSKDFEKVVGLVKDFPEAGNFTYGAYILDPKGQTIGVWFSSMNAGIEVNSETNVVSITSGVNAGGWFGSGGSGVGVGTGGGSGVGVGVGGGGGGVGIRLGF